MSIEWGLTNDNSHYYVQTGKHAERCLTRQHMAGEGQAEYLQTEAQESCFDLAADRVRSTGCISICIKSQRA